MPSEETKQLFEILERMGETVAYRDLLIEPGKSAGSLEDISLDSFFSPNVPLRVPFVSAAMDTVTEAEMAIAMAELGGLGVIHRNLLPSEQVKHVTQVKSFLHGRIDNPVWVFDTMIVREVIKLQEHKTYRFHGFLVLDSKGVLAGLVTRRHLERPENKSLPVGKVMIPARKLVKAKPDTSIEAAYKILRRYDREAKQVTYIPLVNSQGRVVGLYTAKDLERIFSGRSLHNVDSNNTLCVAAAIGVGKSERRRAGLLAEAGCNALVIDTAHGHTKAAAEMVRWCKHNLKIDVVAGNIATEDAGKFLQQAGADTVKVGVGPGSICTTRGVTGIGVPQATAVYRCSRALEETSCLVCADGGVRQEGDAAKAIALGASSVMMGSIFAGTREAPGKTFMLNGQLYKPYRGMGSPEAMRQRSGSRDRYGQKNRSPDKTVAEGVDGAVPYKGELETVFDQCAGALRATLGYAGAKNIRGFQEISRIVRLSASALAESDVHDITITASAPNYHGR